MSATSPLNNIEVVLAVDTSGSMAQHMGQVQGFVEFFEKLVPQVRVLRWNTKVTDKPGELVAGGGSDPKPMIRKAAGIFDKSLAKRRWLIVLTDGEVAREFDLTPLAKNVVVSFIQPDRYSLPYR